MKKRSKIAGTIIIILLIAAAGAAVIFGYYQFQLPSDTYAVIYTKINGWNPEVVKPGEFRIEWEGLIPANLSMQKIVILPHQLSINRSGELPSSDVYSRMIEGDADFSYEAEIRISYTLTPETLPALVEDRFLREDNINGFYTDYDADITAAVTAFLTDAVTSNPESFSADPSKLSDPLYESLNKDFPNLSIAMISINKLIYPDIELYNRVRELYLSSLEVKRELEKSAAEKTATKLSEETAKIELLRKYGELFTSYPALLDYFALENKGNSMLSGLELPDFNLEN